MPYLPDLRLGALQNASPDEKMNSLVKQLSEWARLISNEKRTDILKDTSGTERILIGITPDGDIAIVMSKEGESVIEAFS